MADDETQEPAEAAMPDGEEGQLDLAEIRVEALMLQVASELTTIGAGQLGLIPQMVNGGDALQASFAIAGADALVGAFVGSLPPGTPVPAPVEELRRAIADLKLAFAEAVRQTAEAQQAAEGGEGPTSGAGDETPPPEPPAGGDRPSIWTPRGEV